MSAITIETISSSDSTLERRVARDERGGSVDIQVVRNGLAIVVAWACVSRHGRRTFQKATFRGADATANAMEFSVTKLDELVVWLAK